MADAATPGGADFGGSEAGGTRPDVLAELDRVLGPVAMLSLERRGLLVSPEADPPGGPWPERSVLVDRVRGALLGAAAGNALGRLLSASMRPGRAVPRPGPAPARLRLDGRRGTVLAETQELMLSVETLLDGGRRAPALLSDRLLAGRHELRGPGRAVLATIDGRLAGVPWFEAGVDSYGNGATCRAAAAGLVLAGDAAGRPVLAGLDAAVTHASTAAVAASVVVAETVARLVRRPAGTEVPADLLSSQVARCTDPHVAAALRKAHLLRHAPPSVAIPTLGTGPHASSTVAVALWCVLAHAGDPVGAIVAAASAPGDADTIAAVTGAVAGAAWGVAQLPDAWTHEVEHADRLRRLADRVVDHLAGTPERGGPEARPATGATGATADGEVEPEVAGVHIWFLLDRSGSMQCIAGAVVDGFNRFLDEQRRIDSPAVVTLVQFDDGNPHEVLLDAAELATVAPLDRRRYRPRGLTPLYDALGMLLDRAEETADGSRDQLVVVLTDGLENASRTWTRQGIFTRIAALQERGWTFVFLGANQDSYATGAGLGVGAGNTSDFRASTAGVDAAWHGLDRATRDWRSKTRRERRADRERFWGDRKEAELVDTEPSGPWGVRPPTA